jgi:hypothetical protein
MSPELDLLGLLGTLASPASGSRDPPLPAASTRVADGDRTDSWTLDKIGVPLFIGVVSSFGAWLVTWGSMSNQVNHMDELLRELRPELAAVRDEVQNMEVTGSRGLQDFRSAVNARLDGMERVLSERDKRLGEAESKVLLLTERQGQTTERLADMADQTQVNRDAARIEHDKLAKAISDHTEMLLRSLNYSGVPSTPPQSQLGGRPPRN